MNKNIVKFPNLIIPKIYLTATAYSKIKIIVDIAEKEIGWLGLVDKINNDYIISDVFIPEQGVSSIFCSLSPSGQINLTRELRKSNEYYQNGSQLMFWGHSHVNMATVPSSQDIETLDDFYENVDDYFISGIFNKRGDVYFSINLVKQGLQIEYLDWEICADNYESLYKSIEKEISEKLYNLPPVIFNEYEIEELQDFLIPEEVEETDI